MKELQADFTQYILEFKKPSGTSRGVLQKKKSYFIKIWEADNPENYRIGECGLLKGLSIDAVPEYSATLQEVCDNINEYKNNFKSKLEQFPSIVFGLEMALQDFQNEESLHILFPSPFTQGEESIQINGLIWMGTVDFMKEQIKQKLEQNFQCIKLKIGAINFEEELNILKKIREEYSPDVLELRVDANGAFSPEDALEKLKRLSELNLHSIEQPIRQKQWEAMAKLCEQTPLPIALDEELIGVLGKENKQNLLETIKPQYIILKPSLVGGFDASKEWIDLAEMQEIGSWLTSALESNIGLNAIAQWTYQFINEPGKENRKMPQGLGTGKLYTNNFDSPMYLKGENLFFDPQASWDYNLF